MIAWLPILISAVLMQGIIQPSTDIVRVAVPEASVEAGKENTAIVMVVVKKGYHIQRDSVSDEYLVPTTIAIETVGSITIEQQTFPRSKTIRLEGSDIPLRVFDGEIAIRVVLKAAANIQRGKCVLQATLRYQACDSKSCLAPKTLAFVVPIEVL